jgi:hypothetical protein
MNPGFIGVGNVILAVGAGFIKKLRLPLEGWMKESLGPPDFP